MSGASNATLVESIGVGLLLVAFFMNLFKLLRANSYPYILLNVAGGTSRHLQDPLQIERAITLGGSRYPRANRSRTLSLSTTRPSRGNIVRLAAHIIAGGIAMGESRGRA